jgi:hypothetical protein
MTVTGCKFCERKRVFHCSIASANHNVFVFVKRSITPRT